jgi:hypothetical protein
MAGVGVGTNQKRPPACKATHWVPTLLVFAHSLAMRKPSAEAREKVRFL